MMTSSSLTSPSSSSNNISTTHTTTTTHTASSSSSSSSHHPNSYHSNPPSLPSSQSASRSQSQRQSRATSPHPNNTNASSNLNLHSNSTSTNASMSMNMMNAATSQSTLNSLTPMNNAIAFANAQALNRPHPISPLSNSVFINGRQFSQQTNNNQNHTYTATQQNGPFNNAPAAAHQQGTHNMTNNHINHPAAAAAATVTSASHHSASVSDPTTTNTSTASSLNNTPLLTSASFSSGHGVVSNSGLMTASPPLYPGTSLLPLNTQTPPFHATHRSSTSSITPSSASQHSHSTTCQGCTALTEEVQELKYLVTSLLQQQQQQSVEEKQRVQLLLDDKFQKEMAHLRQDLTNTFHVMQKNVLTQSMKYVEKYWNEQVQHIQQQMHNTNSTPSNTSHNSNLIKNNINLNMANVIQTFIQQQVQQQLLTSPASASTHSTTSNQVNPSSSKGTTATTGTPSNNANNATQSSTTNRSDQSQEGLLSLQGYPSTDSPIKHEEDNVKFTSPSSSVITSATGNLNSSMNASTAANIGGHGNSLNDSAFMPMKKNPSLDDMSKVITSEIPQQFPQSHQSQLTQTQMVNPITLQSSTMTNNTNDNKGQLNTLSTTRRSQSRSPVRSSSPRNNAGANTNSHSNNGASNNGGGSSSASLTAAAAVISSFTQSHLNDPDFTNKMQLLSLNLRSALGLSKEEVNLAFSEAINKNRALLTRSGGDNNNSMTNPIIATPNTYSNNTPSHPNNLSIITRSLSPHGNSFPTSASISSISQTNTPSGLLTLTHPNSQPHSTYGSRSASGTSSPLSFNHQRNSPSHFYTNSHSPNFSSMNNNNNHNITEESLILLASRILQEHGAVPVGKMGSLLHRLAQDHRLPSVLKEKYGGLKKFLLLHPDYFELSQDHPYNPTVSLKGQSNNVNANSNHLHLGFIAQEDPSTGQVIQTHHSSNVANSNNNTQLNLSSQELTDLLALQLTVNTNINNANNNTNSNNLLGLTMSNNNNNTPGLSNSPSHQTHSLNTSHSNLMALINMNNNNLSNLNSPSHNSNANLSFSNSGGLHSSSIYDELSQPSPSHLQSNLSTNHSAHSTPLSSTTTLNHHARFNSAVGSNNTGLFGDSNSSLRSLGSVNTTEARSTNYSNYNPESLQHEQMDDSEMHSYINTLLASPDTFANNKKHNSNGEKNNELTSHYAKLMENSLSLEELSSQNASSFD